MTPFLLCKEAKRRIVRKIKSHLLQERNYAARQEAERKRRALFDEALAKFKKGKIEEVGQGLGSGTGPAGCEFCCNEADSAV